MLPWRGPPTCTTTRDLATFVQQLIASCHANVVAVLLALIYLERFKQRLPASSTGAHDTPHRLFFVALMLASKFLHDHTLTNRAWSKLSGLFSVDETNKMELDFLGVVQYRLYVEKRAFDEFLDTRLCHYDRAMSSELKTLQGPLFTSNPTVRDNVPVIVQ